jgi:hypothetical protein
MARDADRTRGSSSSPSKYINHPSAPPQQVPSSTCPFITSVILPRRLLLLSVLLALDSSSSLGRAHGHSGSPPPLNLVVRGPGDAYLRDALHQVLLSSCTRELENGASGLPSGGPRRGKCEANLDSLDSLLNSKPIYPVGPAARSSSASAMTDLSSSIWKVVCRYVPHRIWGIVFSCKNGLRLDLYAVARSVPWFRCPDSRWL